MIERSPTLLVTGASSGFGREIAIAALNRGYNVVATARKPSTLGDIVDRGADRVLALALDVGDEASIAAAISAAEEKFGQIDVLVNNAGIGMVGSIEECSAGEVSLLFDINFHGAVRLIQSVLPAMRRRRAGMIVNMSSRAGVAAVGGCGVYAATKFAIEGMSEALRLELAPLGIGVMLVEPGAFRTDYASRSLVAAERVLEDYAATSGIMRSRIPDSDGLQPGDPVRAAAAIMDAVGSESRPFRLVLGAQAASSLEAVLEERLAEIREWAEVSRSVDFPED